jgi:hypothetical protein
MAGDVLAVCAALGSSPTPTTYVSKRALHDTSCAHPVLFLTACLTAVSARRCRWSRIDDGIRADYVAASAVAGPFVALKDLCAAIACAGRIPADGDSKYDAVVATCNALWVWGDGVADLSDSTARDDLQHSISRVSDLVAKPGTSTLVSTVLAAVLSLCHSVVVMRRAWRVGHWSALASCADDVSLARGAVQASLDPCSSGGSTLPVAAARFASAALHATAAEAAAARHMVAIAGVADELRIPVPAAVAAAAWCVAHPLLDLAAFELVDLTVTGIGVPGDRSCLDATAATALQTLLSGGRDVHPPPHAQLLECVARSSRGIAAAWCDGRFDDLVAAVAFADTLGLPLAPEVRVARTSVDDFLLGCWEVRRALLLHTCGVSRRGVLNDAALLAERCEGTRPGQTCGGGTGHASEERQPAAALALRPSSRHV